MTEAATIDDAGTALRALRRSRRAELEAQTEQLQIAVTWAALHSVDSIDDAAQIQVPGLETGVAIAGPGAPLVAEFSVAELALAMGIPEEWGRDFLGEAIELAHRLPRTWARVTALDLPAWRARRIARSTQILSQQAAAHVDRHVSAAAHKIRPAQLDRLVDEATARFMPELAEQKRRAAGDTRCFMVDHRQESFTGTSRVYGELDLLDARDLDAAVAARAQLLAALGCDDSLDARRSIALGEIARTQLALDVQSGVAPRDTTLYVHISSDALTGDGVELQAARVENLSGQLVTAEQVRQWCAAPATRVTVRPVLDLADHVSVTAYEVPDRIREQVILRDASCAFPWCNRPARRCDLDHITPYDVGGATATDNLAPLCRHHHRLKTHGGWTYTAIEPGTYLWRSPHGHRYLRDHTGTEAQGP